jgi:hypothetical protein
VTITPEQVAAVPVFEVRIVGVDLKDVPLDALALLLKAVDRLAGGGCRLVACRDDDEPAKPAKRRKR